jgi:hypothetical protein
MMCSVTLDMFAFQMKVSLEHVELNIGQAEQCQQS